MPTKLSRYCDGIMEAVWLAAVIIVPLFFNVYSSRIFEPDKITLLRTLALVMIGAWVVKLLDEGQIRWQFIDPGASRIKTLLKTPLVIPVLALAMIYLIATVLSVTPAVSFWGSYQRLQGTYTTLSYIVLFAAIAGNLRRRGQVDRLITTIVLVSLPVALYGVLQRYKIDPIPWAGDVSKRIASSMGNSIFVAAYMIMVFPLTLGRIYQNFRAILNNSQGLAVYMVRATIYVFIAALQVIAIYMSGSRGPTLGWGMSLVVLVLLFALIWHKRWMAWGVVAVGLALGIFLLIFNLPESPLASLRASPAIGRFGQLLDPDSNSALVRRYIWEGTVKLVLPHEPLNYPDGSTDKINFLRPLIGYGPESMYVAYNPFYIPELGRVEKRNASPDRAHNETWDSVVITGVIGLIIYLGLFTTIFYYGFKWLGVLQGKWGKNLFLGLFLGGGVIGAIAVMLWRGFAYIGVGLPFGLLFGMLAFLVLLAIVPSLTPDIKIRSEGEAWRLGTLLFLLVAIIGHLAEINFGIAIAVTRTYTWVFAGLMLILGYIFPIASGLVNTAQADTENDLGPPSSSTPAKSRSGGVGAGPETQQQSSGRRSKPGAGRTSKRRYQPAGSWLGIFRLDGTGSVSPAWLQDALIGGLILAIILTTLGYDFFTNSQRATSALSVFWNSLTQLKSGSSVGILAIILTTWLLAGVIFSLESGWRESDRLDQNQAVSINWKALAIVLGTALGLALVYWVLHSSGLAYLARQATSGLEEVMAQVRRYEGLLTRYYAYLFFLILLGALILPTEWPLRAPALTGRGAIAAPVALLLVLVTAVFTNLRVVQADIAFKLAEPFASAGAWPGALSIYHRANQLAPNEDYYYLYLGRGYLEQGKALTDQAQREDQIAKAAQDLVKAQSINPLNTDHTANLARLYSMWASYTNDPALKKERAEQSSKYFQQAVILSPGHPRLWDEWALLQMNVLKDTNRALELYQRAMEIDPEYDWTYGLMGDYISRQAQSTDDPDQKKELLDRAAEYYNDAIRRVKYYEAQNKYSYLAALGNIYSQQNRLDEAIPIFEQALKVAKTGDRWRVEETLARLYYEKGDIASALVHASNALSIAPQDQKQRLQELIKQLQG